MAQKIKLRRGGIGNIGGTIAVAQGELLLATGSIASTDLGNVVFISNADGNNTFTPISTLYSGTATTFSARLDGLPFYDSVNYKLLKLNSAGNTTLNLANNLAGNAITGSLTISSMLRIESHISASGNITGSNLYLSGNANIDGNIILGGNITIGNASTDNISLGGEFTSNIVPDSDDTYSLGTSSNRWRVVGSSVTASMVSASTSVTTGVLTSTTSNLGTLGSAVNANSVIITNTNIDTGDIASAVVINKSPVITLGGDLSGNVTLTNLESGTLTATIAANSVALGTDTTGDYVASLVQGTGVTITNNSGETSTPTIAIGQSIGTGDSPTFTNLTLSGNLTVQGTTTTVDSTIVNIGDNIIVLNSAGVAADGGIQIKDVTGTQHTGSLLWNASNDYWYSGISGSTHYRVAELASGTPITTNKITKVDSNGRLVASTLTDDGTNISLTGLLTAANISSSGYLYAGGNLNVGGTSTISGAATFGSTVGVTGITTLSGLLNANGGIAVDTNAFTVADTSGNTSIGGTLGVTGATILSSTLSAGGSTLTSITGSNLSVNTFLKADASKGIASVALTDTSGSADVYFAYSAASGFFATSVIDGGQY